ncbi:MAG: hypothetical protein JKY49_09280 [Cohaesibacteraceae bacterium]|nr:hypothetical protein [Cohaesibacteraceae bacterium]MBL4875514.1 hypothetical protein [Cohaesibacteraceae bacterium]
MKIAITIVAFLVSGVILFMMTERKFYGVEIAYMAEYCRAEVILNYEKLGIAPDNISCKIIHHDILVKMKISNNSDYQMSCSKQDSLFKHQPLENCSFFKQ